MSRALLLCCVLVIALPQIAGAEWHFTPMIGLTFKGRTSGLVDWEDAADNVHRNFGGAVTLIRGGTFGVEAIFVDTPGFFRQGKQDLVSESRSIALMGNFVVTAPRRWTEYTLRPFISGGFGLIHLTDVDKPEALPVRTNLGGFNVGGGAIGFLSRRTGVRFDLRYYRTLRPVQEEPLSISGPRVRYLTLSVGVVLRR